MIRIIQLLRCNWDFFFFFVNSRSLLVKQCTKPPLLSFSVIAINQNNFLFTTTREKSSCKVRPGWLWEISPNPGMRLMLMLFVSLQMIQAIQVLRFHLLELEKVIFVSLSLSPFLSTFPPSPFFLLRFSTAEVQASGKFA